jgi:TRAP-type transport system periplasmic protein
MTAMKKIVFLAIGMISVALVLAGSAWAQTVELKFAHFMSPMHAQHQKSFEPFCKKVEELTKGKVKIKLFPGGALGGPTQLPDAVKTGITDIAFIIPSYTTGRFDRFSVLDLPFMVEGSVHATKVIYEIYDKYLAPDFKDYKVLWMYSCGPGQLHSATKPIHTVKDLEGMKMRAPSAYMSKVLKLAGATPVSMPISELTVALQKGVIDGMLTPYSAISDFRLFDLVKYVTQADVYVSPMAVVMNKEKFASLPADAKKAIEDASGKNWGLHAAQVYVEDDDNAVKEGRKLGKIEFSKLPDSEKEKFMKLVKGMESEWVQDMAKKGLPAREILEATHAAAKKYR